MFNIAKFFSRIQNTRLSELTARQKIVEILVKLTSVTVQLGDISFKDGVLIIQKISQVAKSEIFIKKQIIIDEVNKLQIAHVIQDIKF